MSALVFHPWIGSRYRAMQRRLMLVGESHYGEPDEIVSEGTRIVVEKWKNRDWNIRYLVAAARTLTGLEAFRIDRREALEEIAFYNFVQVLLPWHNVRPTADQFRASVPAFLEAVEQLDPTHILVTGREVWRYCPSQGQLENPRLGGQAMEIRHYRTPSGTAKATSIPHLSRGFSPPRWYAPIQEFLRSS